MHTPLNSHLALWQAKVGLGAPLYGDNTTVWRHMSTALHDSVDRVLELLIAVLPGILAFFVAVILFTLLGMGLSVLLRRGLKWVRFDERLVRNRAEWTPTNSPTELVARASFWACEILGLIIGVSAFDASYASASNVPNFLLPYAARGVGAIVLLVAGTIVARFLARSVLISAVNAQLQYARILSLGVKWLVLVLTAAMVLDHLEIGGGIVELAFGILFGGIVFTLSLAVGLGSRDVVSRSLESQFERSGEKPGAAQTERPGGTGELRHF
ncbi:MAG: hypothetical protein WCF17_01005 [Terracidiphilus sp.]